MPKQPSSQNTVDPALADRLGAELMAEVRKDAPDTTRMKDLIARGANLEYEVDGYTPLLQAALKAKNDAAFALLDAGANPDANKNGMSSLILSVTIGHAGNMPLVQKLLDKGAQPDAHFHGHKTALMWAAHRGFRDIATEIANRGGDIMLKSTGTNPKDAIEWAEDNNKMLMADMLRVQQKLKEGQKTKQEADAAARAEEEKIATARREFEAAVLENVRTHKRLVAPRRASFKKRTETLNQQ